MNDAVAAFTASERLDARLAFAAVARRFNRGRQEEFDAQALALELGWPLARTVVALSVLEAAGLMESSKALA